MAILLRYCAGPTEAEVAATMGISGALNSHIARDMAALRTAVERAIARSARPRDGGLRPSGL